MQPTDWEARFEHVNGYVQGLQFALKELISLQADPTAAQKRVCHAIEQARASALASPATTEPQLAGLDAAHLWLCGRNPERRSGSGGS